MRDERPRYVPFSAVIRCAIRTSVALRRTAEPLPNCRRTIARPPPYTPPPVHAPSPSRFRATADPFADTFRMSPARANRQNTHVFGTEPVTRTTRRSGWGTRGGLEGVSDRPDGSDRPTTPLGGGQGRAGQALVAQCRFEGVVDGEHRVRPRDLEDPRHRREHARQMDAAARRLRLEPDAQ